MGLISNIIVVSYDICGSDDEIQLQDCFINDKAVKQRRIKYFCKLLLYSIYAIIHNLYCWRSTKI